MPLFSWFILICAIFEFHGNSFDLTDSARWSGHIYDEIFPWTLNKFDNNNSSRILKLLTIQIGLTWKKKKHILIAQSSLCLSLSLFPTRASHLIKIQTHAYTYDRSWLRRSDKRKWRDRAAARSALLVCLQRSRACNLWWSRVTLLSHEREESREREKERERKRPPGIAG